MLHCNRRIGAREPRQLIPHVAFRFHFWGRKVNWNQASHGRASSIPTLYACCLTKRSCHFLFVTRVGLCCWVCDFAVSFLVPPDGPKHGTVKVLFFCSFTKQCMRSQKWDRQAVPFLGPCLGSFFRSFFCISFSEAQCLGFNEALWLMATGRATVYIYICIYIHMHIYIYIHIYIHTKS